MITEYTTIRAESSDSFYEKKSRFIGSACPCSTEEEAVTFIRRMRSGYKDASHNCYAYVIGENSGIMRYSDDGEPGGTAGLPIMDVLQSGKIVNCCVVVTRYFGGILLGTGGLVRAYTQGCKIALHAAGIVRMEMTCRDHCEIPYSQWNQLQYASGRLPVQIVDTEYGQSVSFVLLSRLRDREYVENELFKATCGSLKITSGKEKYEAWDI